MNNTGRLLIGGTALLGAGILLANSASASSSNPGGFSSPDYGGEIGNANSADPFSILSALESLPSNAPNITFQQPTATNESKKSSQSGGGSSYSRNNRGEVARFNNDGSGVLLSSSGEPIGSTSRDVFKGTSSVEPNFSSVNGGSTYVAPPSISTPKKEKKKKTYNPYTRRVE